MNRSCRDPAARERFDKAKVALSDMDHALRLLDEVDVPADVGAHLDLAINRLKEWLPPSERNST